VKRLLPKEACDNAAHGRNHRRPADRNDLIDRGGRYSAKLQGKSHADMIAVMLLRVNQDQLERPMSYSGASVNDPEAVLETAQLEMQGRIQVTAFTHAIATGSQQVNVRDRRFSIFARPPMPQSL
jgi:hypothetical protein